MRAVILYNSFFRLCGERVLMQEKDIWLAAQELIKQKQDDALLEAMKRQYELLHAGDETGAAVWQKIADAIEFIQMPEDLRPDKIH